MKINAMRVPSKRKRLLKVPNIQSKRFLRILAFLAFLALIPPVFFHFRLRRFHQMRLKKCGWLESPPLVCAHGGDSSRATPNTMDAYRMALNSHVDCIEIDVSRSSDGVLFALHNRDLQRISQNGTTEVGYMSMKEIKELDAGFHSAQRFHRQSVPTVEDALVLISSSVSRVILDAKIGPPSYEKGLAKDILSVVNKTHCGNCLIWAKSDTLGRDVIMLTQDVMVGYIVMRDLSTGATSNLVRMKGAEVAGVYYPLIDEKLVRTLKRRGKKIYAWTVDELEAMQNMLYQRVDAIVTGHPSLLQGLMQELKTRCLEDGFLLP